MPTHAHAPILTAVVRSLSGIRAHKYQAQCNSFCWFCSNTNSKSDSWVLVFVYFNWKSSVKERCCVGSATYPKPEVWPESSRLLFIGLLHVLIFNRKYRLSKNELKKNNNNKTLVPHFAQNLTLEMWNRCYLLFVKCWPVSLLLLSNLLIYKIRHTG